MLAKQCVLNTTLDQIMAQITAAHLEYVDLQCEARRAYGLPEMGNPHPMHPATITEGVSTLTRIEVSLHTARNQVENIRKGMYNPIMKPSWIEVQFY